jgi:hypothetical protein
MATEGAERAKLAHKTMIGSMEMPVSFREVLSLLKINS